MQMHTHMHAQYLQAEKGAHTHTHTCKRRIPAAPQACQCPPAAAQRTAAAAAGALAQPAARPQWGHAWWAGQVMLQIQPQQLEVWVLGAADAV